MKNIKISKIIFCILLILASARYAWSECYDENVCFKDYVKYEDKDLVLAINRDTNAVELFWSDKEQTWIKPDEKERKSLQKSYNKTLQLRSMQKRLDRMRSDTWYNTDQNVGTHR